ncbi:hypothetical protein [Phenylobacterium koreense]|uniref:Chemotaxis protein CheW n=1 Tax=Phenylobacterium koreense TaxID=266125 RepID=A0ABV2EJR9_9CAUL
MELRQHPEEASEGAEPVVVADRVVDVVYGVSDMRDLIAMEDSSLAILADALASLSSGDR